jgi:hypothetical protein
LINAFWWLSTVSALTRFDFSSAHAFFPMSTGGLAAPSPAAPFCACASSPTTLATAPAPVLAAGTGIFDALATLAAATSAALGPPRTR